jgi:hypothetical protein
LWKSDVGSELTEENDIFGASAEGNVFCLAGRESDA